ncbi:hypothetical protein SAMN02745823_02053 [Sporobacter termitidis DSM 10068]|uniref:ABC-type sugar transport system, substrate-binding protein, contains N-terminal xre family HTH domain n=1 Tax=Sporobacter termitidis DSM 10068 TaxID=1123282 RepID=A0A1M5XUV7_9FIRM|nr:hypothetical protein [Sporobacter termitidis]SHI03502.1 hypothetical protein SAMN02745823_02053 [Sporobacter termitidis DSM 10068]
MKKVISACFAILLIFSLFACSGKVAGDNTGSPSPTSPSTSPSAASPSASAASPTPSAPTDSIGIYDPDKDYSSREPYKVVYLSYQAGAFGQTIDDNFKGWSTLLNLDYAHMDAQTMDDFYNQLQVYADQGYDGYILDGDPTTGSRTLDLTKELGIKNWMTATSALKNDDGTMMWPAVTLDSEAIGEKQTQWLYNNYTEYFGEIDTKQLGYIYVDYSVIPNLHESEVGAENKFKELFKDIYPGNFFVADLAGEQFTADAAYNKVSPIMSSHSEIKYWMIAADNELYGTGAARAQEALGYTSKNAITISINGDSLYTSWDTGYDGCWVAAVCSPMKMFTGPIINALVSMMDGGVTAETLWPEYVAAGNKYAENKVLTEVLTKDNYKAYLAEVDKYAPYKVGQQ